MNHRVASRKRRQHVAHAQGKRIVPRGDEPHDAQWVVLGARLGEHRQRAGMARRAKGLAYVHAIKARAVIEVHHLVVGVRAGLAVLSLNEVEDELFMFPD